MAPDTLSLVDMCRILLRHRRLILRVAACMMILAVAVVLLGPRTYTAVTSFYPKSTDLSGTGLASLAAQAGLNVPGQDETQSPAFYSALVTSSRILRAVVDTTYNYDLGGKKVSSTLAIYYGFNDNSELASARAIKKLSAGLTSSADPNTGIVRISVKTKNPELSAAIAKRLLQLIDRFDTQTRQTQAAQESYFLKGRLEDTRDSLRNAETTMQEFLERNRDFRNSPQLVFEQTRLQRAIDMEQALYTSLAQGYERSRLDEVRNTPVVTLVEEPMAPPLPDGRHLIIKGMVSLVLGALLGLLVAVFRDKLRGVKQMDYNDPKGLSVLWHETMAEFRRPWRLFTGRSSGLPPQELH